MTIGPNNLTFNEYAKLAGRTAIYPGRGTALGLSYVALKLAGEAGEFAENVGKAIRDDELFTKITIDGVDYFRPNKVTSERLTKLRKEAGDALWYISQICLELGMMTDMNDLNNMVREDGLIGTYGFGDIALENIEKLASRQKRGVLGGSGDER